MIEPGGHLEEGHRRGRESGDGGSLGGRDRSRSPWSRGWGLGSPLAAASSSRRCTASGWGSPIGLALVRSSSGRRGPPPMVWWSAHICTTQRKRKASHVRTSSACSLARHLPCPPMSWAVCVVQCPSRTSRSVTTFSSTSVSLLEVTSWLDHGCRCLLVLSWACSLDII